MLRTISALINQSLVAINELIVGAPGLHQAVLLGWTQILVSILVQAITVPLYLAYLTPGEFGVAAMLNAFVVFSTIGVGGIWSGGIQYMAEKVGRRDHVGFAAAYRVTRLAYVGYGVLVCLLTLGAFILWPPTEAIPAEQMWPFIAAALGFILLNYQNGADRIALFARAEIVTANLSSITALVVSLVAAVALLHIGLRLVAVPLASIAGVAAAQVTIRLHWRKRRVALSAHGKSQAREVLSFLFGSIGGQFQAQGILALILSSDVLLIGAMGGPAMAAQLTLLWKPAEVAIMALSRFPEALQPHLIQLAARQDAGGFSKLYRRSLTILLALGLLGGTGYAVFGPFLVELWVGPALVPRLPYGFALAGVALFFVSTSRLPAIACMARRRIDLVLLVMTIETALKIALTLVLLQRMGAAATVGAWSAVHAAGVWGLYQGFGYQIGLRGRTRLSIGAPFRLLMAILHLGLKPIAFAALYRATLWTGLWVRRMPVSLLPIQSAWPLILPAHSSPRIAPEAIVALAATSGSLADGDFAVFGEPSSHQSAAPDWHRDPLSGDKWPNPAGHWSDVDHFGATFDIKNIWDPARFWWAPALAAQARQSQTVEPIVRLNDWTTHFLKQNPINQGPLWSCGQETSIRAMNLLVTAQILEQDADPSGDLVQLLIAHGRRIRPTLFYAVAQMNNHAINEAAGLYLLGHWLARLPLHHSVDRAEVSAWARVGKRVLEEMVAVQVAPDGGHVQRSIGYQRVVVDALSLAEAFRRRWGLEPFSQTFRKRAKAAAEFLFEFVEPSSGKTPLLGSLDGSRGFDLAFVGIDDYRPSVQLSMNLFSTGAPYGAGPWDAPLQWLSVEVRRTSRQRECRLFDDTGYITLSTGDTWGVLVLPRYRIRAGHADGLHLDLWRGAENWLVDGGTYSYFSRDESTAAVSGVWGHNTIAFDAQDQMERRARFIYAGWPHNVYGEFVPSDDSIAVEARMTDFRGCVHRRRVAATPRVWTITDTASGPAREAALSWRLRNTSWKRSTANRWTSDGATITLMSSGGIEGIAYTTMATSPRYGRLQHYPALSARAKVNAGFITRFELADGSQTGSHT